VAHVIRVAEWWRDPVIWATYSSLASLPLLMLYLLKPYTRINCSKLADVLAPLVVFHFAYGLVTMLIDVVIDVDLYRILLWYFAVYLAALAVAVAGGDSGRSVGASVSRSSLVGIVARAYGLFYALWLLLWSLTEDKASLFNLLLAYFAASV